MRLRIITLLFLSLGLFIAFSYFSKYLKVKSANNCVAIGGDSVAAGNVEYYNTSTGKFVTKEPASWGPLSNYVNNSAKTNFAQGGTSLVSGSYDSSGLVNSGCQYFVLGPWVNDFGNSDPGSVVNAINGLIGKIKSVNPNATIFVINYYVPQPANWTSGIWPRFFSGGKTVDLASRASGFNSALSAAFGAQIIDSSGSEVAKNYTDNGATYDADGVHLDQNGLQSLGSKINQAISSSPGGNQNSSSSSSSGSGTNSNTSVPSGPAKNGLNVGPELAYPEAGANVVVKNNYTGVAAVINNINNNDSPNNPAPGAQVVLRLDIKYGASDAQITNYANQLAASNAFHNTNGKPTVVVFGIEENNLDQQGWNFPGADKTASASQKQIWLDEAADQYYHAYNVFSTIIHSNASARQKYQIAPAAPDLYNGNYDPKIWVARFAADVNCNLVDGLVADVFNVTPASGIPGGPLDTWQYWRDTLSRTCGRKLEMLHFEGWGEDPSKSIAAQVAFLKTQPLVGAPTATTLIVNNCGSFGGNATGTADPNKQWLFWIPTQPDKVFDKNGNEFNYIDCSGSGPKPTPFDLTKEVPCDSTTDPEFHSLRPYPASPCYKKVDETALMCGNDLILKRTFTITGPGQAPSGCVIDGVCSNNVDGSQTCNYKCLKLQDSLSVDLTNAKLPILGNTEDVPNGTWTSVDTNGRNLSAAQRMNNYVSWYLNGVINRAEQDFHSYDSNYLVNYSGPLNKLLPFTSTFSDKIASVDNAQKTTGVDARHNALVGCISGKDGSGLFNFGGFLYLSPCYLASVGVNALEQVGLGDIFHGDRKRLTDFNNHKPPLEADYKTFPEFWKKYISWLGSLCSPNLPYTQFYICISDETTAVTFENVWSKTFEDVPLSSTEDRVGLIETDTGDLSHTQQLINGQGNGGTVSNVSFIATNNAASCTSDPLTGQQICDNTGTSVNSDGSASHALYFAHAQEDAQMAKLLQNTFATKGTNDNWEGELERAIGNQNLKDRYMQAGCMQVDVRTNPGDSLHGNIDRQDTATGPDHTITGKLQYDATFSCNFTTKFDQGCFNNCIAQTHGDTATCNSQCTSSPSCNKDIYTSMAMYTRTPKAYEIWQRLVGCDPTDPNQPNCKGSGDEMGIFKRFYPKPGIDSVLTSIKDIPAVTQVSYNSDTAQTRAGLTGTEGSDAQIYFPHVGSLEEYFLNGIQKALRPKGFDSTTAIAANSSTTTSAGGQCKSLDYTIAYTDITVAPKSIDDIISQLKSTNPGGFTDTTITNIQAALTQHYQEIISKSIAAGYNPSFVLAVWIEETAAGTLGGAEFGCGAAPPHDFEGQLACFLGLKNSFSTSSDFASCRQTTNGTLDFKYFMLFFSEGTCNGVENPAHKEQFCINPQFPGRLINFYNLVKS